MRPNIILMNETSLLKGKFRRGKEGSFIIIHEKSLIFLWIDVSNGFEAILVVPLKYLVLSSGSCTLLFDDILEPNHDRCPESLHILSMVDHHSVYSKTNSTGLTWKLTSCIAGKSLSKYLCSIRLLTSILNRYTFFAFHISTIALSFPRDAFSACLLSFAVISYTVQMSTSAESCTSHVTDFQVL